MAVIATIAGTGLRPGISKNRRYYSPEVIGKAVARAQQRLADEGGRPLTMRVAHPDPEKQAYVPVTETAGRITGISLAADGSMRFTADLYDTREGRDVLALYDNRDQQPALKNVSIRGRWLGDVSPTLVDGMSCEAADDLELDGIDFTHLPGVDGAEVDVVDKPGAALESAGSGALIYESCEEMHVTETVAEAAKGDDKKPYGDVAYADPGYQKDGKKRYPVDTEKHAKAAWSYINQGDNAKLYTSAQLKRIKSRIGKALGGFGVKVEKGGGVGEAWLVKETALAPETAAVAEGWYGDDLPARGGFSVNLDNGVVCINVSSYCIDPHDLSRIGTAAMQAAVAGLLVMDPDDDGDIDVPGAPYQDTDHGMEGEAAPAAGAAGGQTSQPDQARQDEDDTEAKESADPAEPAAAIETPASTEDAANITTESEAPVMTDAPQAAAEATPAVESTTPAAPASPAAAPLMAVTPDALAAFGTALGEALAAKLAPPAAAPAPVAAAPAATEAAPAAAVTPATEAAPVADDVVETEDQRVARLVSEALAQRDAALQTQIASGRVNPPARKGLVGRVNTDGILETAGDAVNEGIGAGGLPAKLAGNKAPHELAGQERGILSALMFEHVLGNRAR